MKLPRIRLRYLVLPVVCAACLGYFAHHTINGARGLVAYQELQAEARQLKTQIAEVQAEKQKLEARVSLLRPESLNRDMIDERARIILNLAGENEITILREAR